MMYCTTKNADKYMVPIPSYLIYSFATCSIHSALSHLSHHVCATSSYLTLSTDFVDHPHETYSIVTASAPSRHTHSIPSYLMTINRNIINSCTRRTQSRALRSGDPPGVSSGHLDIQSNRHTKVSESPVTCDVSTTYRGVSSQVCVCPNLLTCHFNL